MTAVLEMPTVELVQQQPVRECVICLRPSGQWTECDRCRSMSIRLDQQYARREP